MSEERAEQPNANRTPQKKLAKIWLVWLALAVLLLVGILATFLHLRYGGGSAFPDRSGDALWSESQLEVAANLDYPAGNIAVTPSGRVFFTLHPEARPPVNIVEWRDEKAHAWPSENMQPGGSHPDALHEVLSIRIDQQNRLWALDNGTHGLKAGRLLAFDLDSGKLVHNYSFPRELAGLGSHLNDFQVSPDGETIYIADASFFAKTPAILVYDVVQKQARRVIEQHESVDAEHYLPVVQGRAMQAFGLVTIRPGVDSIALSPGGDWLYFAPVTNNYMYRVATRLLRDPTRDSKSITSRIKRLGLKTMSDGLTTDQSGNIYISDLEHSAILRMSPKGELTTLLKTEKLRWPDGFSFGPDGWLYVTASSLHQVIGLPPSSVKKHAPYQVFRIKTDALGRIGH
ncbi:MAG: SMP-30/gluconolactonase/LRE family protein [Oceanococcus sp.]